MNAVTYTKQSNELNFYTIWIVVTVIESLLKSTQESCVKKTTNLMLIYIYLSPNFSVLLFLLLFLINVVVLLSFSDYCYVLFPIVQNLIAFAVDYALIFFVCFTIKLMNIENNKLKSQRK